uniref:Putative ribonuclease H-like domain-containing protein n=1 Tax=Tanacetum cinerariifolium TaxID=118510 RepID=A0A6L2L6S3_TANCI|nr:putative ribonuclease H-like domain-containing protein [Tanacetum cinerariifolium]
MVQLQIQQAKELLQRMKGQLQLLLKTCKRGGMMSRQEPLYYWLFLMSINYDSAKGPETLEQTFNRLQVIVSQLEFMDIDFEQDDLNQKFLTSLAPEWLIHTIMWRNRSDLDMMSLDDLYNHLKIKYEDINQIDEDDMEEMDIKWNMALLSMRADIFWKKTGKNISIQGTDVAGFDKSKVECFNCHKMGHFARECRAPRSQDRGRKDNYRQGSKEENHASVADEEGPIEFALMAKTSAESEDMSWTGLPEFADDTITNYSRPSHAIESEKRESMLWHKRLGHLNFKTMNRLVRHNLVKGLPSKCFENDHTYTAYLKGKKHKVSCKSKLENSVSKPLHTLHMDLFSPTSVSSISHKWYCLVVTDDFSRFTWTFFLKTKDETSGILRNFITEIENMKDLKVKIIRCDNGGEFRKKEMKDFYSRKGIKREFSIARTPQQNGVAEMRNKTLMEAARTMLADAKPPVTFWAEVVNTACYVQNRVLVNKSQNKTPYELFNGKFDAKGDEGYFIGYSMSSKAFRVFNKRTKRVKENLHVDFLKNKAIKKGTNSTNFSGTKDAASQETLTVETPIPTVSSPVLTACFEDSPEPSSTTRIISKRVTSQDVTPSLDNILTLVNRFDDILGVTTSTVDSYGEEADVSNMETTITASPTPILRIHKDHPKKPKKISDALQDPSWVEAMLEKLLQFKIQNVWSLVDCPKGEERIDYDEVFAPVARIKAIRLFLAYALFIGFTIYQMDVKSAFLYGTIDEEVYVMQPPGFQDLEFPVRVYKVKKAMYGFHQAPRAWQRGDFILIQVYVDDIIFGSSNPQLCKEFEAFMHEKVQMSAMGELNFFLGLQVLQKKDGIFLSQDKYVGDILKKFRYPDVKSANTPMDKENPWGKDGTGKDVDLYLYRSMIGSLMYLTASRLDIMFAVCACAGHQVTPKECHLHAVKRIFRYLKGHPKLGLWYPKESPFDLVAYSDSDYGGATQDRKSTTGGC